MKECPCRFCNDRSIECHGTCSKYKEWNAENQKRNQKIRDTIAATFLSRTDRPKRRHGRK